MTRKQLEILNFIKGYIRKNKISPTFEEIMAEFNLKSKSSVHAYLTKLEQEGYIIRHGAKARGIEISSKKDKLERALSCIEFVKRSLKEITVSYRYTPIYHCELLLEEINKFKL